MFAKGNIMDNHKRLMLYCVLDAVQCNDTEFLETNKLEQFLDTYKLDIKPEAVRHLTLCSATEMRSKMRLVTK